MAAAHFASLAREFLTHGGTIEPAARLEPGLTWVERRAVLGRALATLSLEVEQVATRPGFPAANARAMTSALGAIDISGSGYVARTSAGLAGIVGFTTPDGPGSAHVEWIGTAPGLRGTGAALLATVLTRDVGDGGHIDLRALPTVVDYYARLGFTQTSAECDMLLDAAGVTAARAALQRVVGAPERGLA